VFRIALKAKIHRATLTFCDLNYDGSITIDEGLMDMCGIKEYELVQVLNLNNGERLMTYVIRGERGKGQIGLNGPAARKGQVGDKIIIASYSIIDEREEIKPVVILVDGENKPIRGI